MAVKQVIVVRRDLNIRRGKLASQAAHASLGSLLKFFNKHQFTLPFADSEDQKIPMTTYAVTFSENSVLDQWLNGIFTKICLYVNSEEELKEIEAKCNEARIPNALITDAGLTEFHGVPTVTCLGIGPWESEEIDKITGNLPLY